MSSIKELGHSLLRKIILSAVQIYRNECLPAVQAPIQMNKQNTGEHTQYQYLPKQPDEKLRIVFLFQISSLWHSWKTLWEACVQDPNIDVKLVLVERTYAATSLQFMNEARNFLIEQNIPFVIGNTFSLHAYLPHVVFIQTPYDDTLPPHFGLKVLKSLCCRIAYVPYGLEIGGGLTNLKYQFNMPIHQQAWRIFGRSPRHSKMYAKYCSAGCSHIENLGHPRMDLLQNIENIEIDAKLLEKIKGRKTILWTPHFSVGEHEWSTFLKYYTNILGYFAAHDNLFLVVRPHPLLFSRLRDQKNWTEEKINAFKQQLDEMPNVYLDTSANYLAAFKVSDALMTDAGSFLLEYLVTKKPICYLHNPKGPGLNDDGDIIQYLYSAVSMQEIEAFLTLITADNDYKKEQRIAAIAEYLVMNNQGVGNAIKEFLINEINQFDRPLFSERIKNEQQEKAENYWKTANNTHLSPPEYYDKQESMLQELLNKIGKVDVALDVGCGDGRFTKIIHKHARYLKAIDISQQLIEKAKNNLSKEALDITAESITDPKSCHSYDFISCMGVLSGVIDNETFLRTIDTLVASCKQGGYLLLKESLSLQSQRDIMATKDNNYTAVYRNEDDYIHCFASRGCKLIEQRELARNNEHNFTNKLYLFTTGETDA